ncbi:MAG TPA: hypothetical protein VL356_02515 [Acidocella sp.]|nr:hypothetical protein [Acidocella sp.]
MPTLRELRKPCGWWWVHCPACHHKRPMAIVPLIIRWGPDTPDDWVRQRLVCAQCGHRGALLYAPSWVNSVVGWQSWPDSG